MATDESDRIVSYFEDPPLSRHHLLEVRPDGIAYVDEHGVICHANERLEALSGPPLPSPKLDSIAMQFEGAELRARTPQSGSQSSQMADPRHPFHGNQIAC
jgi:PAS domain-containing protein